MQSIVDRCINPNCRGLISYEEGTQEIRCPWCEHAFGVREFEGEYKKIVAAMAAGKQAKAALDLTVKEKEALQALLNKSQQAWVDNAEIQRYIAAQLEGITAETTAIKKDTGKLLGGQTQINETLNDVLEKVPDQNDLERMKTDVAKLVLDGVRDELRRAEKSAQPAQDQPIIVAPTVQVQNKPEKKKDMYYALGFVVLVMVGLLLVDSLFSTSAKENRPEPTTTVASQSSSKPTDVPTPVPTVAAKNVTYTYSSKDGGTLHIRWDACGIWWNIAVRDMTSGSSYLNVGSPHERGDSQGIWYAEYDSKLTPAGHTVEYYIYPKEDSYNGPTSYRFEYTFPQTQKPSQTNNYPVGQTCEVWVGSGRARSNPGEAHELVEYVKKGEEYNILDRKPGTSGTRCTCDVLVNGKVERKTGYKDWYKIVVDGNACWVSSGIVKIDNYYDGTMDGYIIIQEY